MHNLIVGIYAVCAITLYIGAIYAASLFHPIGGAIVALLLADIGRKAWGR